MKHLRRCWKPKFFKKGYFSSGKNLLTFLARVTEHDKHQGSFYKCAQYLLTFFVQVVRSWSFYKCPQYLLTFFVQVIRSFLWGLGAKFKIISVRPNWLLKRNVCGKSRFSSGNNFRPLFSRITCDAVENTKFRKRAIFTLKMFSAFFSRNIE